MMYSTHNTFGGGARGKIVRAAVAALTGASMMAILATPMAAHAQRRGEPQLRVSYATDAGLTCDQLTLELARMEEIAGISAQNAQNAETQGAIANGATSVAISAALYSGALGSVPGLGLFANMAGGAARRNAEVRARAEAERIRIAEQRHSLLTGIYQGRQCGVAPTPVVVADAPTVAPAPAVEPEIAPAETAPIIEASPPPPGA